MQGKTLRERAGSWSLPFLGRDDSTSRARRLTLAQMTITWAPPSERVNSLSRSAKENPDQKFWQEQAAAFGWVQPAFQNVTYAFLMGRAARLCPAAASDLAVADPWGAGTMMMPSPREESPRDQRGTGGKARTKKARRGAWPSCYGQVIGGGRWKTAARHVQGEWRSVPAVQTGLEQFCSGRITCSMAGTGDRARFL